MNDFVRIENMDGGIRRLTMCQPGKKNAMNAAMRDGLRQEIERIAADTTANGLVLTGADGEYSAGGDIQGLMAVEPERFRTYLQQGHLLVKALWSLEKPAVAAIEGVGVGGGLALAMCCDFIVMGRSARIGFTFSKIGFVPDWGTPYTVVQRVGPAAARRLFQQASLVDAETALSVGLVDSVVDDSTVQEAALAQARRLTELPPRAFALTKRVLQTVPPSLESALELELIAQQSCFKSDEFMAGVAPFVRKPQA